MINPTQAAEFAEGNPRPCMLLPERRSFHVKYPQLGPDRRVGLGLPRTGTIEEVWAALKVV